MKDFAKSIRTGNSKELTIIAPNGEQVKAIDYDQWHYKCVDTGELVEKRYSKVVGNRKVGNEAVVLKDGDVWVVLYANETKSKEFDSEAEARKFAASVGNKKVGNSLDYNISTLRSMVTRAIGYNELGALQDAEAVLTDARYEREEKKKEAKRELENCENELREIEKLYSQVDSAYKKLK